MSARAWSTWLALWMLAACDGPPGDTPDGASPDRDAGARIETDGGPRRDGGRVDTQDSGTIAPLDPSCTALPDASGTVVHVSADMADDLPRIVREASAGTTILLADGTYPMGGAAESGRLRFDVDGVTLRGESGDAARVIIDARYETNELISITASDVTIADVTLTRAVDHLVHVTAASDATTDPTGVHLYRLRLIDAGEQFVKVNANGAFTHFVDRGRLECSSFEMTDDGRPHVERSTGGCYTGGIDLHNGRDWVIRQNHFEGIYCAGEGLAEHAIHLWRGTRDPLIENNVIIDCARGIGLGLSSESDGMARRYDPDPYPGVFPIGNYGGVVRNNVVFAEIPYYDTGLELAYAYDVDVYHNTIVSTDAATGFFSSIDYRFENTLARIQNNLTRRISQRNGGVATLEANLENASMDLFVDAANHDFHLRPDAASAIDQGVTIDDSGLDLDGDPRTDGSPDLGADER